jgi:tetratricopeptide (TPR) repeat protein
MMPEETHNPDAESAEFVGFNLETITELATFAEISEGFTLAFAEMNFGSDLQFLLNALEEHRRCKNIQFVVIKLEDPELEFVLGAIKEALAKVSLDPEKKPVLLVVGLERAIGYVDTGKTSGVIANLNFARNAFPKQLPYPVVFVLPDYALTRLARGAHDFWAWTSASFQFRSSRKVITQTYQKTVSERRLYTSDAKPVKQERIDQLHRLLMQYEPTTGRPEAETEPLRLNILEELADAYLSLSDVKNAQHFYMQALSLAGKLNNQWTQANVLLGLGQTSSFLDTSTAALNRYNEALELYKATGDRLGEANTLKAIGDVLQFLDQRQEALNRYNEALELYKATGDRLGEANTLQAIGDVLLRQEDLNEETFQQGLDNINTAYKFYCEINDRYSQARILLTSIIPMLRWQGEVEKAIAAAQEAADLAAAIGYEPMQQHAAKFLAELTQS